MTDIIPFKGISYNPGSVPLQHVVAPADALRSPDRRNALVEQHQNNIARLLMPPAQSPASDAVRIYNTWIAAGILAEERTPVLYVVEQIFKIPEGGQYHRRGFIARWRFPESVGSADAPTAAAGARTVDTGLWGTSLTALYDDPTRRIDRYISFAVRSAPMLNVVSEDVRTTIWRLNDGGAIAGIVREMKEKKISQPGRLAEYESACSVRALCRAGNPGHTGNEPYNFAETLFINTDDPGIVSFPLHRWVMSDGTLQAGEVKNALRQALECSEYQDRAEFLRRLDETGVRAVGLAFKDDPNYILGVAERPSDREIPESETAPARTALGILDEILNGTMQPDAAGRPAGALQYVGGSDAAWQMLDGGRAQAIGFVPSIPVDRIRIMISSETAVPDRLFDVIPALPAGLVFHKIFE